MEKMNNDKAFAIIKMLAIVGLVLASYLIFEQITFSPFRPCDISNTINCDAIISGAVAKTWGIPTPVIGGTGYLIILVAAIVKMKKLVLAMATFGLGFCLWIAYKELFILHVICPICLLCQLDMISVFGLGMYLNWKKN